MRPLPRATPLAPEGNALANSGRPACLPARLVLALLRSGSSVSFQTLGEVIV